MLVVPLRPIPNQALQVQLGGQACNLAVYQTVLGLFMDVSVGSTLIIAGVLCENLNRIVRSEYLGFLGDFAFADTQGTSDPEYAGLGSRWQLLYLDEDDLEEREGG